MNSIRANLDWVTDSLAVGGDLSTNQSAAHLQIRDIIDQGITHIIDMRSEADDTRLWAKHGVEYLWLGTHDAAGHHISPDLFDRGVEFARTAIAHGGKVLSHCHMGINRGPSMGFAILLDQGLDPVVAFDLIRSRRSEAAIYYAQDALAAHATRERRTLAAHLRTVFTPAEEARIQHIIRRNHLRDWGRVA